MYVYVSQATQQTVLFGFETEIILLPQMGLKNQAT